MEFTCFTLIKIIYDVLGIGEGLRLGWVDGISKKLCNWNLNVMAYSYFFLFWFDWQQCGQHVKEIDYGGWPAPRNHMTMKQGYEVCLHYSQLFFLWFWCLFSTLLLFQAKMNEHHHNNLQKGNFFHKMVFVFFRIFRMTDVICFWLTCYWSQSKYLFV